jgi:hypothetical protein
MRICTLLLKGGKAIQAHAVRDGSSTNEDIYSTDDMDILVMPNPHAFGFTSKNIAIFMGALIRYIVPNIDYKDFPRETGSIVKIALVSELTVKKNCHTAIADIGYDDISLVYPVMYNIAYQPNQKQIIIATLPSTTDFSCGDIAMFIFPTVDKLLHEYLYWLIKYHNDNKKQDVSTDPFKNNAFIAKSKNPINRLLEIIGKSKTEQNTKENLLKANINFITATYLRDINVDQPNLEEIKTMILSTEELDVPNMVSYPTVPGYISPCWEPRVRTPLAIRTSGSSSTVNEKTISGSETPVDDPAPVLLKFDNTPPRNVIIKPVPQISPKR